MGWEKMEDLNKYKTDDEITRSIQEGLSAE